ncbi:hypothetical protein DFQ30_009707 [Apophysomyces sp. BC1015]|nr:hypothetical protein DFQ30_009707 [Apophysomyces sp. BC1015]
MDGDIIYTDFGDFGDFGNKGYPNVSVESQPILADPSTPTLQSISGNTSEDGGAKEPLLFKYDGPITPKPRGFVERMVLSLQAFISNLLICFIMSVLAIIALVTTWRRAYTMDIHRTACKQDEKKILEEKVSADETYYAKRYGYDCQIHRVVTEDGHVLVIYRISKQGSDAMVKPAVLMMHGLLQCSGVFVVNEEKSIAFALADQGYDVWIGNNRAVATREHMYLDSDDPEYWNWGLKEIGAYDFAAMVVYVRKHTGQAKIAYIGHSQGNAQGCIGLALRPEIAESLSCFVALAPAVFSGSLTSTFLLDRLIHLSDWTYRLMFGIAEFLPITGPVRRICPPSLFAYLAYSTFAFVFAWWDHHWLRRRKTKYFQFTPRPVSTRLIRDWLNSWGRHGLCMYIDTVVETPGVSKVPLAVFYGTKDYLVDGDRFVQMFETRSLQGSNVFLPMLDLVHVERIEGYEHMDTIWAHDNSLTTYPGLFKVLAAARWE